MSMPNPVRDQTRAVFEWLSENDPVFVLNQLQNDYSDRVADALGAADPGLDSDGEVTLLQAATGTGKSLGYLIPVLVNTALTGERALISTYTNHLARQLAEKDGARASNAVEAVLGKKLHLRTRMGRRNFVDLERIGEFQSLLRSDGNHNSANALDAWIDHAPETFYEAREERGLVLPADVNETDICLTGSSSSTATTAYDRHRTAAEGADVIVTNHAVTLLDAKLWNRLLGGENHDIRLAVFDEADMLPSMARSMSQSRVALYPLMDLARDSGTRGYIGRIQDVASELTALLGKETTLSEPETEVAALAETLREILDELSKETAEEDVLEELRVARGDLGDWIAAFRNEEPWLVPVLTSAPVASRPAFAVTATAPARMIARLWSRRQNGDEPWLRAAVFTSATLAAPSHALNYNSIMNELGINPGAGNFASARSSREFEPTKFGKLSLRLSDRKVPSPSKPDGAGSDETWLDYVGHAIEEAQSIGGRTLVLTTSYMDTEALGERVGGIQTHERGLRLDGYLTAFEENEEACLVTPAAWAGVDLPDMIDHLIIPRIPFPAPDLARNDVLIEAMRLRGRTEDEARGILIHAATEEAKRKLRQGIGRALRQPDSEAVLWMLDPRFPLPNKMVINPRNRMTQGLAVSTAFKKNFSPSDFSLCLPKRFRIGPNNAYDNAEVFKMREEVAA